jgi:hypothetical protein
VTTTSLTVCFTQEPIVFPVFRSLRFDVSSPHEFEVLKYTRTRVLVYFSTWYTSSQYSKLVYISGYKSVSIEMKLVCVKVESFEVVLRIPPAGQCVFHFFPRLIQDVITEGIPKILSARDSPSEKFTQLMKDSVLILCTGSILDPRFKMIQHTKPEFTEPMIDMKSVFEFELLSRCLEESADPKSVIRVLKTFC